MNNKKLKKSLDFCNKENIPYVIILGEDEITNQEFKLKDMINKEEKIIKKVYIFLRPLNIEQAILYMTQEKEIYQHEFYSATNNKKQKCTKYNKINSLK